MRTLARWFTSRHALHRELSVALNRNVDLELRIKTLESRKPSLNDWRQWEAELNG